jgi:hypothetical protein
MQSFENQNPTSPTKRLGVALNVDTNYKASPKDVSPPSTPNMSNARAGKGNAKVANRALNVRSTTRETFLDDITPIDRSRDMDPDGRARGIRDSHDLSLSPRQITRDSLVDNMLLSLDQFSFGGGAFGSAPGPTEEAPLYAAFGDEEPYSTFNPSRTGRGPGHGHSYSSDYENPESTTRSSSQMTRGRRSNSSSNFQLGLGRINSIRNDQHGSAAAVQRSGTTQPRPLHSRSGKGSKGSSLGSVDLGYAQVSGTQRWARGNMRSSSFDYGHDRQNMSADFHRPRQDSTTQFSPYDYDAAPTPTVPGGPRRTRPLSPEGPYMGDAMPAPTIPIERKRSTKSSKSHYKSRADVANGLGINFGLNDAARELPPLPAFIKEPAPAPLVGYGKAKEPPQQNPSKERPGFFRRVFGSSRNTHAVQPPEPHSSHGSTTSSVETSGDRPGSRTAHVANQMRTQPQTREPPPAPTREPPHVLTKKTSFFRRRKKSVSEPELPPPPVPVVPHLKVAAGREDLMLPHLPSPVSSLRKVMNPYLSSPLKDSQGTAETSNSRFENSLDLDDDVRGFSPGYTPDKKATIRTVKPESRGELRGHGPPSSLDGDGTGYRAASAASHRRREDRDDTFLQDSSDNDRDVGVVTNKPTPPRKEDRLVLVHTPVSPIPPTSPSVARDMALVAEYERTHSKRSTNGNKLERSATDGSLTSVATAASKKPSLPAKDEDWVVVTPTKAVAEKDAKEPRVWLEPTSSEEDLPPKNLTLPLEGQAASDRTSGSTRSVYKSATSLPIVQVEGDEIVEGPSKFLEGDEPFIQVEEPEQMDPTPDEITEGDRDKAKKIYDGNEDFIQQSRAAAWLGEEGVVRQRTLIAYMELYDFMNLNILAALRMLCSKLVLKAESQQVDRILVAFSGRWCQCNPNHGFKVPGK